jgi:hypothetical protein
MNDGDWIPAGEAVMRLKKHSDDPRALLVGLLKTGDVTAQAGSVYRAGGLVTHPPCLKRKSNLIKAHIWQLLTVRDWHASVFGFSEPAPVEEFGSGESLDWLIKDVSINWAEVSRWVSPLSAATQGGLSADAVPANRQLDYPKIKSMAAAMLSADPLTSIASAAASISADIPKNPKTGKNRDWRHIERIISPLWGEALKLPSHKP